MCARLRFRGLSGAAGHLVAVACLASAVVAIAPAWAVVPLKAGNLIIVDPEATITLPSGTPTGVVFFGNPQPGGGGPIGPISPDDETAPNYFNNNQPSGVALAPDNSILVAQKGGFTSGLGGVISVDPSTTEQTVVS